MDGLGAEERLKALHDVIPSTRSGLQHGQHRSSDAGSCRGEQQLSARQLRTLRGGRALSSSSSSRIWHLKGPEQQVQAALPAHMAVAHSLGPPAEAGALCGIGSLADGTASVRGADGAPGAPGADGAGVFGDEGGGGRRAVEEKRKRTGHPAFLSSSVHSAAPRASGELGSGDQGAAGPGESGSWITLVFQRKRELIERGLLVLKERGKGTGKGSRVGGLGGWRLLIVVLAILLQLSAVSGDRTSLEVARQRTSDTFTLRKLLSGESTYPDKYRMYDKYGQGCCGGDECVECIQEAEENLQAVRLTLENEINLLRSLGCPCQIDQLLPRQGEFTGGTVVRITVSGLDLTKALALGKIYCWVMKSVETYEVVEASQVGSNELQCVTPAQGTGTAFSEITLHADSFAITAGATSFTYFDPAGLAISAVTPLGAPSHGGTLLTISGVSFDTSLDMWCYFDGVTFKAREVDEATDTAICETPVLSAAVSTLRLSLNELDPLDSQVAFTIYDQPRILDLSPKEGFGGELLYIQAAGLGFRFQPDPIDILCRFLIADGNQTIPAARIGNSSTITCTVPKNRRGIHQITGNIPVEISLIGNASTSFTRHTTTTNRFLYKCRDVDVPFTGIMNFFPQCTQGMCCPAGHVSNGTYCNPCAAGTWSLVGDNECHRCPENSLSPPVSPNIQSCICVDGYVGTSNGIIAQEGDVCNLCGSDTVAFIDPARRVETRYSRQIHTLGEYGVFGQCQACPEFSNAPAESIRSTDCTCGVGYMCTTSNGEPCYYRLYKRFVASAQRTCISTTATNQEGNLQTCTNISSPTIAAVPCTSNCSTGAECDLATGNCVCAAGFEENAFDSTCEDIDECTLGSDTCHEFATCQNTDGSFVCTCLRGYVGDGSVDCWDGSFSCSGAIDVTIRTADGSACWATTPNASVGTNNELYCDQNAGTTDNVYVRVFWLELQQWSQEIMVTTSGYSLATGTTARKVFSGLSWTGSPAKVQYRIGGADAFHPEMIGVRIYNGLNAYNTSGEHAWVDTDGCTSEGCYEQSGNRIVASAVHDFDECALGFHSCDPNANCTNMDGFYTCACNAGYYGVGTTTMFGPGTECVACAAGEFSLGGTTVCTSCPDAHSTSPVASFALEQCLCKPGYYGSLVSTNSTCIACPEDHYCPLGPDIFSCPLGSHSPPRTGSVLDCLCDEGRSGPPGGPCPICRPGTTCQGGWLSPVNCSNGNYSTAGSTSCTSCTDNGVGGTKGGDQWCTCDAGYYFSDFYKVVTSGTCYSSGCSPITTAQACSDARLVLDGLSITSFSVGENASAWNGSVGCLYSSGLNKVGFVSGGIPEVQECSSAGCLCQGCAPPQCTICDQGKYAAAGAAMCIDCPFTTSSEPGSTSFDNCTCASGFYGDIEAGENCTRCPTGSDSDRGSEAISNCLCHAGFSGTAAVEDNCGGSTVHGAACASSFEYLGSTYTSCITLAHSNSTNATAAVAPWCVLQSQSIPGASMVSEDAFNEGRGIWWDYCECSTCSICGQGKFTDTRGQTECVPCESGKYSTAIGATTCNDCQANSNSSVGADSSSDCHCVAGYNLTLAARVDSVGVCSDIDECGQSLCDSNSTCNNTVGSFTCTCNSGYYADGDESGRSCADCSPGYFCSGAGGRELCSRDTYSLLGAARCTACPFNSSTASVGSSSATDCICHVGYVANMNGTFTCDNIDECSNGKTPPNVQGNNCDNQATCTDTDGSFICTCPSGLSDLRGDGTFCESSCGDGQVGGNETCDDGTNAPGSGCSDCQIERGWTCSGSPSVCTDLNECAANVHDCTANATCVDSLGSFTCYCNADFFGSGIECFPCPRNASGPGNTTDFDSCSCDAGYKENLGESVTVNSTDNQNQLTIPFVCDDVDECTELSGVCHQFATCSNTVGSFTCQCLSGFTDPRGDGTLCLDIDECAQGTDDCDQNARCLTTNGSFTCECQPGYRDISSSNGTKFGTNGSCEVCVSGQYSSGFNNTICETCPANSFSTAGSPSFGDCRCVLGYAGANASVCAACPVGFYSDAIGREACLPCEPNATTAMSASASLMECVCSSGFHGNRSSGTLECTPCDEGAITQLGASSADFCFCGPGYWENPQTPDGVDCLRCGNCSTGYERINCQGSNPGSCENIDECNIIGAYPCDPNADCQDTPGSFKCICHENRYGDGLSCLRCPDNAISRWGSTTVRNCSCSEGFDTGDGSNRQIFTANQICSTSIEIVITVAQPVTGERSCWSNNSMSREYCDENAGTLDDVWLRIQWADRTYTDWYALYSSALHEFVNPQDPGAGFNFSAGLQVVASLTSLEAIGGEPYKVEYYVDGEDSFRPASIVARFKNGLPLAGIGSQDFTTRGQLCWVDRPDPQAPNSEVLPDQRALGCDVVGPVAAATLLDSSDPNLHNATSEKEWGLLSQSRSGDGPQGEELRHYRSSEVAEELRSCGVSGSWGCKPEASDEIGGKR